MQNSHMKEDTNIVFVLWSNVLPSVWFKGVIIPLMQQSHHDFISSQGPSS